MIAHGLRLSSWDSWFLNSPQRDGGAYWDNEDVNTDLLPDMADITEGVDRGTLLDQHGVVDLSLRWFCWLADIW